MAYERVARAGSLDMGRRAVRLDAPEVQQALADPERAKAVAEAREAYARALTSDDLEVTAQTAYRPEVVAGFRPPEDYVARTACASPDGKHVAFLVEIDEGLDTGFGGGAPLRSLRVRWLADGKDVEVARARGMIHARWKDPDTLLYDLPAALSPTGEKGLAKALAERGDAAAITEEIDRILKGQPPGLRADARRKLEAVILQADEDSFHAPLMRFSPKRRESVRHHPGAWVRLWAGTEGPAFHRKGRAYEVMPEDETRRE
jgi:hypothetical protein